MNAKQAAMPQRLYAPALQLALLSATRCMSPAASTVHHHVCQSVCLPAVTLHVAYTPQWHLCMQLVY